MKNLPECKIILDKLKNELPSQVYYHTIEHTLDVYNCTEIIAKKEGVNASNLKLLLVAAIYHDTGYLLQNTDHEQCSCQIARKYLSQYHYTKEEIDAICDIIMATKIPQNPKSHLEEIICDADLDYLGRDDFFKIGNNLYKELVAFGKLITVEEWNSEQESFMKKHHYFTETSINCRQSQKEKNLKILQSKIKT
jgi:uncharacterized protein